MPTGAPSGCGGVKCLDVRLGNPRDIAAGKQTPQQVAAQLLATMPALQVSPASAGGVTSHQWRRQLSGNAVSPLNLKSCCPLSRQGEGEPQPPPEGCLHTSGGASCRAMLLPLNPKSCCAAPVVFGRPCRCEPQTRLTATPPDCVFLRRLILLRPSGQWIDM